MTTTIQARPTLYKGIQMRSRLEADYAASLDTGACTWKYEPECFASETGQWLPDFGWTYAKDGPLGVFVEIKPAEPLIERYNTDRLSFHGHVDSLLARIAVAWESRPDVALHLIFWRYGGPPYLSVMGHRETHVWHAEFGVQPMYLLWPGMGQSMRCRSDLGGSA